MQPSNQHPAGRAKIIKVSSPHIFLRTDFGPGQHPCSMATAPAAALVTRCTCDPGVRQAARYAIDCVHCRLTGRRADGGTPRRHRWPGIVEADAGRQ